MPDMTLERINDEPQVYLLPVYELDEEQEELLEHIHDILFEIELDGWWTEEADWPQNRDLQTFKDWFSVEFHSVVEDLVDAPLIDEG